MRIIHRSCLLAALALVGSACSGRGTRGDAQDAPDVVSESDASLDPVEEDPVLDDVGGEPSSDAISEPDGAGECRWRWEAVSCFGDGCPEGSSEHVVVWMAGYGKMLVFGGGSTTGAMGLMYDPVADDWEATAEGVLDGDHPAAVWTGSRVLAWWDEGSVYDPITNTALPISTDGDPPVVGSHHAAIWTGSEMIVWGGGPFDALTDHGARYDPVADTWRATSRAGGCPGPRWNHTAIWTGEEMIVWGGDDGTVDPGRDATNTGGGYDPVTDTWQATPVGAGCPVARDRHTAVWDGASMIIWGGHAPYISHPNTDTGARFHPASAAWGPTSTASYVPSGRYDHTAVWTGSEMIVWGGIISGGNNSTATGGHYDPVTDTWTPTTSLGAPGGRYGHTAVWTGSEMIIWGGRYRNSTESGYRRDGARYRCVP